MVTDSDQPLDDELFAEEWDIDDAYEAPAPPAWRRPLIIAVAAITVAAMTLVPLYNLISASQRPVAPNGLEICTFDYCVVQDAIRAAELDLAMSRFSNMRLDDESAAWLVALLVERLGVAPVSVVVVNGIDGGFDGRYDPASRTIVLERPTTGWTVVHEVAHVSAPGHGDEFLSVIVDLTAWLDQTIVD